MIKVSIRSDKLAVVRFNHKTECNHFKEQMNKLEGNTLFPIKIKIKDERR